MGGLASYSDTLIFTYFQRSKAQMKIFLNFCMVILVALPWLSYPRMITPPKTGFYCNDETLAHPFKQSTVSAQAYLMIGSFVPLIVIVLVEMVIVPSLNLKRKYFITAYYCQSNF